jgi:hypothetical protein
MELMEEPPSDGRWRFMRMDGWMKEEEGGEVWDRREFRSRNDSATQRYWGSSVFGLELVLRVRPVEPMGRG